jgi:hypothetical protein
MGFAMVIGFINHLWIVTTRSTQRHFPEDGILHSHRCENLKSYVIIMQLSLIHALAFLTTAHTKPSRFVFTIRFLVADPNMPSAYVLTGWQFFENYFTTGG